MEESDVVLRFTVLYRGGPLELALPARSTVRELGQTLVNLTGVAPHTLRLMLPKRPSLQPMSERNSTILLRQSGITEGCTVRMMGASLAEVATVSQNSSNDRIRGFSEEDERARQRSIIYPSSTTLPKGSYIFCDFRTLDLPGIQLNPPPAMAMKIMHKLASDRGITAIMNKHHWRVGVMTELPPVGYVGISPKCILGFNKNRGQEISLRLRTDDLKGFRKYESIKKTLLHELAHMVHDEHDEKFHALDKQLNEEAIALDWTKSQGRSLSQVRLEEEEERVDANEVQSRRGHRLGGSSKEIHHMDPRAAAAAAALRRFSVNKNPDLKIGSVVGSFNEPSVSGVMPVGCYEPDPDGQDAESVGVIMEGKGEQKESDPSDFMDIVRDQPQSEEPDPDEESRTDSMEDISKDIVENGKRLAEPDPGAMMENVPRGDEPDPDESVQSRILVGEETHTLTIYAGIQSKKSRDEPDPDDAVDKRSEEPDPDEALQNCCKEGKNMQALGEQLSCSC